MIEVKDRVPTHPNRVKLTPVNGQANTYDMVRADAPIEDGTPLNRALFENIREVGDVQISLRDNLGENWVLCNGDTIAEGEYPDYDKVAPFDNLANLGTNVTSTVVNKFPPNTLHFTKVGDYYFLISSSGVYMYADLSSQPIKSSKVAGAGNIFYIDGKYYYTNSSNSYMSENPLLDDWIETSAKLSGRTTFYADGYMYRTGTSDSYITSAYRTNVATGATQQVTFRNNDSYWTDYTSMYSICYNEQSHIVVISCYRDGYERTNPFIEYVDVANFTTVSSWSRVSVAGYISDFVPYKDGFLYYVGATVYFWSVATGVVTIGSYTDSIYSLSCGNEGIFISTRKNLICIYDYTAGDKEGEIRYSYDLPFNMSTNYNPNGGAAYDNGEFKAAVGANSTTVFLGVRGHLLPTVDVAPAYAYMKVRKGF